MNKLFQPKFSLSLTHIYIYYPAGFLSVGSDSMEGAKEEEDEEEEEEESASEEALDRHDLELSLGFTRGNLLLVRPVMNTVRSRQVYRIRHRQYFDHTLSNKKYYLSVFSSILVVFRSGVEFLKLRLPFVLQLQSVQLLTSRWLNIIIIIIW